MEVKPYKTCISCCFALLKQPLKYMGKLIGALNTKYNNTAVYIFTDAFYKYMVTKQY